MSNTRAQPNKKKPNIVFLFADDWGRYASIYGEWDEKGRVNSVINTPNFDQSAEGGLLFTRAYAPALSCTPMSNGKKKADGRLFRIKPGTMCAPGHLKIDFSFFR
ncbi:MAG: sulfatase-like hydrolase/transferase [Bacteroidales bacterium]|nr:sulfatase-like hydrolase/transferase [Bacteroidales bacterium]